MIFDKLENIKKYNFKNDVLQNALELALKGNMEECSHGVHQFSDDIKLVKRNFSPLYQENYGEMHDYTIDIHVFYQDDEIIYFDPEPKYTQSDILDINKENDVFYIKASQYQNKVRLTKGTFALFFPGELHKITFANESLESKDKIIIKVKYQD
ncbi:YhcH/YjgK/YiaL family protein [Mycoplasma seminis]|uniref:YhcH/YjgK/YiaL family protein n=1 Tax=Mycoplasma seminis TaxID=512749 RepID=A0ABY9HBI8_9MOLU|nr:YhcH/YjgK/YiaL family protein [Mycoplasma seminis]WLP85959.1 YhcH/YjgK/YiaL family protein [Mycoplasma seminis]